MDRYINTKIATNKQHYYNHIGYSNAAIYLKLLKWNYTTMLLK